jgi:DNA-binding MarR family transcriptional regulator
MSERGIVFLTDEMMEPFEQSFPGAFNRDSTRALFAIRSLAQRVNDDANQWLSAFGLNSASYNYLIALFASKDYTLTQIGIRGLMHTSYASVTQMVHSLERDGFVERTKNPRDGRSMLVKLTPKGIATMKQALPKHHSAIETGMRFLSKDERETLMSLLMKIDRGFDRGTVVRRPKDSGT